MPPSASLEGVRAKLGRADEHLQALNAEAEAWGDREPYTVTRERDSNAEWEIARLSIREQLPPRLALILGDFFTNLRSALDHLAWQLVLLNGQTPGRHTGFPILDHPDKWPGGLGLLNGVRSDHGRLIESLQPYPGRNDPRARALAVVNDYANIDKHREVQPALCILNPSPEAVHVRRTPLESEFALEVRYTGGVGKPLNDGAEIARLRILGARTWPDAGVKVEVGFPFEITLGEGLRLKAIPSIRWYIGAVIDEFARDFP